MAETKSKTKTDDGPDLGASAVLSDADDTASVAKEYDKGVEDRLEAQEDDKEELSDGVTRVGQSIRVGSQGHLGVGTQTTFPGLNARLGTTDAAVGLRRAKGLPETGVVGESGNSWTAQSAAGFTPSNAGAVPGQTFTTNELPDPATVDASILPDHTIPAGLVVDPPDSRALIEDSLNGSQEGGDLATAPKKNRTGPAGPI